MWVWEMPQLNKNVKKKLKHLLVTMQDFFEHLPLLSISSFQNNDLLPMTSYKTW